MFRSQSESPVVSIQYASGNTILSADSADRVMAIIAQQKQRVTTIQYYAEGMRQWDGQGSEGWEASINSARNKIVASRKSKPVYEIHADALQISASRARNIRNIKAMLFVLRHLNRDDIVITLPKLDEQESENLQAELTSAFQNVFGINEHIPKLFIEVNGVRKEIQAEQFSKIPTSYVERNRFKANPTGIRNDCLFYTSAHLLAQAIRHGDLDYLAEGDMDEEKTHALTLLVDAFADFHDQFKAATESESLTNKFLELKNWLLYYKSPNDTEVLLAPVLRRISGIAFGRMAGIDAGMAQLFKGLGIRLRYKGTLGVLGYFGRDEISSPEDNSPVVYMQNTGAHWVGWFPPRDEAYALEVSKMRKRSLGDDRINFGPPSNQANNEYDKYYRKHSGCRVVQRPDSPAPELSVSGVSLDERDQVTNLYKNINFQILLSHKRLAEIAKEKQPLDSELEEEKQNIRKELKSLYARLAELEARSRALFKSGIKNAQQQRYEEGRRDKKAWLKMISNEEQQAIKVLEKAASESSSTRVSTVKAGAIDKDKTRAKDCPRGGYLAKENLNKIRNKIGTQWNVPEHHNGDRKVTVTHKTEDEEFDVYRDKFETASSDDKTFEAMLISFKETNRGENPFVKVSDPSLAAKWRAAFNRVYEGEPGIELTISEISAVDDVSRHRDDDTDTKHYRY